MLPVKKTLIIIGSILGGLLLLCCGGGALLLYFAPDNAYAQPADVCTTSSVAALSAFGTAGDQRSDPVTAFGRTFGSCVRSFDAEGTKVTLTIVVDVTDGDDDAKAHWDSARALANAAVRAGATVEDVSGSWDHAFGYSNQDTYELDLCDSNLYLSLNVTGLPAGTARAALVALAKDLAKALEKADSSGHDWDD
jgi:hypothetical protein